MKIKLKINDVEGMTEDKRHILLVDREELMKCLTERGVWDELISDKTLRNTIYMQEKARRDKEIERKIRKGTLLYKEILR